MIFSSSSRRVTNFTSKSIVKQCISRLFSNASDEDLAIHYSYKGRLPRLKTIGSLSINKGIAPFQELVDLGISTEIFKAFSLKADLEHPLLKKYQFDVEEFIKGAKISIENIFEAGHSEEFINYIINTKIYNDFNPEKSSPNEAITYLKANCNPLVLQRFQIDASRCKLMRIECKDKDAGKPLFNINCNRKVKNFKIVGIDITHHTSTYCKERKMDLYLPARCGRGPIKNRTNLYAWWEANEPVGTLAIRIKCEFTFDQLSGLPKRKEGQEEGAEFAEFTCLFSSREGGLTSWKLLDLHDGLGSLSFKTNWIKYLKYLPDRYDLLFLLCLLLI